MVVEPAAAISIGSSRSILLPTPRPNKITIVQARILGAFEWKVNNFIETSLNHCLLSIMLIQLLCNSVKIRAVDRILKSRIESDLKSRMKSDLSDILTGRKPLLL